MALAEIDETRGTGGNYAFYLSVPPKFFPVVVEQLKRTGLSDAPDGSWRRVVIEKPFGHDLQSAHQLNEITTSAFPESSIFRIDHYLGKETVQNIMALRFANNLYEPIWNRSFVDHVQITMAEDIGIGGRVSYYDGIGAARDVIQNHLLQLLALVAMEDPTSFDASALRREKEKVLKAVRLAGRPGPQHGPRPVLRGLAGRREGGRLPPGGRHLGRVQDRDLRRHQAGDRQPALVGVPFYLRTGKRLGRRVTEVAVVFQRAPHLPFSADDTEILGQNALVVRVQPDEGITVRFGSKVPGTQMEVRDVSMDFAYGESFLESSPEAYERLLLDVMIGDPPLFPHQREVELSWKILDPIEEFWATQGQPEGYESGSWGPESADAMMARDSRVWRRL